MTAERGPAHTRRRRRRRLPRRLAAALALLSLATLPTWLAAVSSSAGPGAPRLSGAEQRNYATLGWELLAGFAYETPIPGSLADLSPGELAARNESLLPTAVRALDGREVAVRGFAIPVEVDVRSDRITQFLLAARNDLGCCFGMGIGVNEWILVEVPKGRKVELETFAEATVLGRLSVGEEVEGGAVLSLYRLRADRVRTG